MEIYIICVTRSYRRGYIDLEDIMSSNKRYFYRGTLKREKWPPDQPLKQQAPMVKWISHGPSKPILQVQLLLGAPNIRGKEVKGGILPQGDRGKGIRGIKNRREGGLLI
jgi:hypothetical protein